MFCKNLNVFQDNIADVKDIDCEFLPLVYEIVKRVEKDPNDASAKNKVNIFIFSNSIQTHSVKFHSIEK